MKSPPGSVPAATESDSAAITVAEFAAWLAPLGPWDAARRIAVAVSGGADSLALAILAQGWGDAAALIVDHGLRASSAAEAEQTRAVLAARGMPARVLTLTELRAGPGLAARARAARYAALTAACAEAGLVDLLLGHHAGDQAETVLMRSRRGSGEGGLAGMAAVVETDAVRLLRPLLVVPPGRMRATLREAGLSWVEDPTNTDMRTTRARLRAELAGDLSLLPVAQRNGQARAAAERAAATELAARVRIYPEGFAVLSPGPVSPAALAMLLRAVAGGRHPVSAAVVAGLARAPGPATLAGVRVLPAGRMGPGWLLVREAAAMAPEAAWRPGLVWDGRFRAAGTAPPGTRLGALGADAARLRGVSPLPAAVLRTLPAIRRNSLLSEVPHLAYGSGMGGGMVRNAALPVCGAAFGVSEAGQG